MRRLRLVAAAVAIVATAAAGGTFAEYVSAEDATTMSETGTLVLELKTGAGDALSDWNIGPLAPDLHPDKGLKWRTLQIHNRGTVDAALYYQAIDLVDHENGCTPPEARVDPTCVEPGELSQQLQLTVERRPFRNGECIHQSVPDNHMWPLTDIAGAERGGDLTVPGSDFICVEIHFQLPADASNIVQSDSSSFRMSFTLKDE